MYPATVSGTFVIQNFVFCEFNEISEQKNLLFSVPKDAELRCAPAWSVIVFVILFFLSGGS